MQENNVIAKWIGIGVATLFVVILLFSSIYYVAPGHRGVMVTLGKVDQKTYSNGIGFKAPFISSMEKMDVRTIELTNTTASYTSDVQTAELQYTFTYSLNPQNVHVLYENVGKDYVSKKITPVLNDVLKDVIGKWQAQDLVANRDKARGDVLAALNERIDGRFFQDLTFQFINIDYDDDFEAAIKNKVVAEQKALEAKNNTARIQEEAQQKTITAKAEAEAMRVKSRALAENQKLVEYEAVLRWDGKLPQYMFSGNGSVPMIQIPGTK